MVEDYSVAYDAVMSEEIPQARLFTAAALTEGAAVEPNPGQAHYLLHVMRLGNGAGVVLFNGRDGDWLTRIEDANKKTCRLAVMSQLRPQISEPDLWLAFAPLKKARTDFIIEKATELGVARLLPVFTEHTNTERVKSERLAGIAIEAAEQCDRLSVPEVADAVKLSTLIENWPASRWLLVPDETGGGPPLVDVVAELGNTKTTMSAGFLIGPEGGFSAAELDALGKLPFVRRIGLGPRILRAETAALAVVSCWQALIGDWTSSPRFNNGYIFNARR